MDPGSFILALKNCHANAKYIAVCAVSPIRIMAKNSNHPFVHDICGRVQIARSPRGNAAFILPSLKTESTYRIFSFLNLGPKYPPYTISEKNLELQLIQSSKPLSSFLSWIRKKVQENYSDVSCAMVINNNWCCY